MFFEILYNVIVMPIEILVSFIYELMKAIFCNAGVAIIAVSFVIQTMLLPFYKKADELQEKENQKQKQMSKWVKHIRKTFKGDERMMMLSTYYRQQNYSVFQALNGSLSLFLQIPFFMAAYHFLSVTANLSNVSFWILKDLGKPDGLINIGGVPINILPILMTLSNVVSTIVYTKDKPMRDKVQAYGLALFFLVILYNRPSGLAMYWFLNNFYSMCKHIILKNKSWWSRIKSKKEKTAYGESEKGSVTYYIDKINVKNVDYWIIAGVCTLFFGVVIPISIFSSSPMEFVSSEYSPVYLVCSSLSAYVGIFILWGGIIYKNIGRRGKATILLLLNGLFFSSVFNYIFFGDTKGEVSNLLISSDYGGNFRVLTRNAYVCYGAFVVAVFLYMFLKKYIDVLIRIILVSFCVFAAFNSVTISKELKGLDRSSLEVESIISPILPVSKNGKNVMVIMLDRAIDFYVPYIFEERPELVDSFDGFVYYPNTISFGGFTNFATPALFGGYEYTPDEMNKRDDVLLADKHNEALKVMPMLFGQNGFTVTVCDPPYAGYDWVPDLNIYNNVPGTTARITEGRYLQSSIADKKVAAMESKSVIRHNTIYYPFVKTLPLMIQTFLAPSSGTLIQNVSVDNSSFAQRYSVLQNLCALTQIEENGDTLLVFQNSATHEPMMLELPDYSLPHKSLDFGQIRNQQPRIEIDGVSVRFDNEDQLSHYHANVATYIQLAKWFDYLKENGVYDNTKIILVSDHGRDLRQFDKTQILDDIDVQAYSSLFMVKDFGATGFETSDDFMTIADVVTYATENVIDNPVNPFTGKAINNDEKYAHPQLITTSDKFMVNDRRYTFDTSGSNWYSVHDNIFDASNWKQVEYQQKER